MKVLLIDTYNMIHRSRFGWMKGDHAITFNFFRSLKSEIDRHDPDKVYIVSEGRPKHRIQENPEYKANRQKITDEGFHRQKKDIFSLCRFMPLTFIRHEDYECDDVIGHLASDVHAIDKVVICSSDSDFIQLLDNVNVSLWNPVKKSFVERWPVDYLTWKSLRGDKTDNVPGIKGVGDKTAMKLASNPQKLKEFLTEDKLKAFESAKSQIRLAKISDNNFDTCVYNISIDDLKQEFVDRGFNSIVEKSWQKWTNTLEVLNERQQAANN